MKSLKSIYLEALQEAPQKPTMMRYNPIKGGWKPPLEPGATTGQQAWDVMTTEYTWDDLAKQIMYYLQTQPAAAWQWMKGLNQKFSQSELQQLQQMMQRHGLPPFTFWDLIFGRKPPPA